jgi:hypothetical protein
MPTCILFPAYFVQPDEKKVHRILERKNEMVDSIEQGGRESNASGTVRIEMPSGTFREMCRLMAQFGSFGSSGSACCDMTSECCPPSEAGDKQAFTFEFKKKE